MKLSLSRGLCRRSRGTIVVLVLAALASLAFAQTPAPPRRTRSTWAAVSTTPTPPASTLTFKWHHDRPERQILALGQLERQVHLHPSVGQR